MIKKEFGPSNHLKRFAGLVALAFAAALAVIVGNRLSEEALAVLAGAVCGVGAAIPTSLLIVAVSRGRDEKRAKQGQPDAFVVVVPEDLPSLPPVPIAESRIFFLIGNEGDRGTHFQGHVSG